MHLCYIAWGYSPVPSRVADRTRWCCRSPWSSGTLRYGGHGIVWLGPIEHSRTRILLRLIPATSNTHTYTHTHTHMHARTRTHTCTHAHTCTHTRTHTHAHTHTHMHACVRAHTHTHTRAHTCINKHTAHVHTDTCEGRRHTSTSYTKTTNSV